MLEALLIFLIWLIVIVVVALIVLAAVRKFLPEVYDFARLLVGGAALILILLLLVRLVSRLGWPGDLGL